jgi:delta-aminolevulinic acid dehydratase/porphobilinogen synthase
LLDWVGVLLVAVVGIGRAGADIIITYFARDAARLVAGGDAGR